MYSSVTDPNVTIAYVHAHSLLINIDGTIRNIFKAYVSFPCPLINHKTNLTNNYILWW